MKKIFGFAMILFMLCFLPGAMAGAMLNEETFPDPNFLSFVKKYDRDGDGMLLDDEISGVTEMGCPSRNIADLTGIKKFTSLWKLTAGIIPN